MVNDWFAAIVHSDYRRNALLAEALQRQARAQLPQVSIRVRCATTLIAVAVRIAPASSGAAYSKLVLLSDTKR